MKNSLSDLNDHLFEALERVSEIEIEDGDEALNFECEKAKMICDVSHVIMRNAQLVMMVCQERGGMTTEDNTPDVLKVSKDKKLAIEHKK